MYNIWLLLLLCIVAWPGLMCNIWYRNGILGGGKYSSYGAIIGTLVGVIPQVIGVGYGVYGVDDFTSLPMLVLFISIGKLWIFILSVVATLDIFASVLSGGIFPISIELMQIFMDLVFLCGCQGLVSEICAIYFNAQLL